MLHVAIIILTLFAFAAAIILMARRSNKDSSSKKPSILESAKQHYSGIDGVVRAQVMEHYIIVYVRDSLTAASILPTYNGIPVQVVVLNSLTRKITKEPKAAASNLTSSNINSSDSKKKSAIKTSQSTPVKYDVDFSSSYLSSTTSPSSSSYDSSPSSSFDSGSFDFGGGSSIGGGGSDSW